MRQTRFMMRPTLALLAALAAGPWPVATQADDSGMDVNFTARFLANTCLISLENGGDVTLPTVDRDWFYNTDSSDRLQPETDAGGTPFTIQVVSCDMPPAGSADNQQLHFQFTPQAALNPDHMQVFVNEASGNAAENVGVVVFSAAHRSNVLNSDGSSDVLYDLSSLPKPRFPASYAFYARYQNTGPVGSGLVTSNVVVNVTYQ
ncbi:fimbrial protein [Superficieibacter electus]|uniref:Fimbrial protein n=1 Tax=Superficieibacter electus TaxID=2022662 RepID=A0A2P5GME9_9ENTR|nr:fimbrial-like protein [Superficieibacter electus]POP41577.1 fimbrial protein [Superficieibacter electus]POP47006.1 fimbrial protein [Superficieibacter electus]